MNAHIHRFQKFAAIAFTPADGETVYLTEQDARHIARLLTECADDINAREFVMSQFVGASVFLENNGSRF